MTEAPATRKHGKNAFLFVIVCVAMDMIGFGIIIPVMPSLLSELTGQPAAETVVIGGYLMATYGILNFAAMPTIGNLSDRLAGALSFWSPLPRWAWISSSWVSQTPSGYSLSGAR